jgi:hypothetical protein
LYNRRNRFVGTETLEFTAEEQRAIRAAERTQGYAPQPRREMSVAGAVGRIIALILGLIILEHLAVALIVGIGSGLSPSTGVQVEAQLRQPETNAPDTLPRVPLSESPESIDQLPLPVAVPPPIMPQIEPQAEIAWETQTEIQDNAEASSDAWAGKRGEGLNVLIGPQPESETAAQEQPFPRTRGFTRGTKQEFDDIVDLLAVLAKTPRLSEFKRQIHDGRWPEVREDTRLLEQPRFDSEDLGRIEPGSGYYVIDTGLWCSEPAGLTWKIVLILTPYYSNLSYEGFACTTRDRAGAEGYDPRAWYHVPVHPQELARRTRMRPGFRRLLREALSRYWTTPQESFCQSRGRRAISIDEGIQ